jgi:hypothetical protein
MFTLFAELTRRVFALVLLIMGIGFFCIHLIPPSYTSYNTLNSQKKVMKFYPILVNP